MVEGQLRSHLFEHVIRTSECESGNAKHGKLWSEKIHRCTRPWQEMEVREGERAGH